MNGMGQFWQWWSSGLRAPWSPRIQQWFGNNRTRFWVAPQGSGYRIMLRSRSGWNTLADTEPGSGISTRLRKRLKSGIVVLQIPQDQAIVRSFAPPRGDDAGRYIDSKLDESSPLPSKQRYFDYSLDDGKMTLAIARKTWVDESIVELGTTDVVVDQATVEGLEHTPLNLLPGIRKSETNADIPGLVLLLAGTIACIVGYYVVTQQQYQTLSMIAERQQQLQNELIGGQPVRDRIQLLQDQVSAIDRRKSGRPSSLSLLADVTRVTPDHTWVRNWILDGSALTLLGETTDTADLLSGLEASPLLSEVRYESAITRDPANDRERFRISATVAPR